MGKLDELERIGAPDRASWRRWLKENHEGSPGVWLVYFKKASGKPSVSYDEAVEEALCFGWIDSLVNSLDEERYMQVYTPRKRGSVWSKPNKERVARVVAAGLMTEAGLAKIEAAKADGSWSLLDPVDALLEPEDLKAALDSNPDARAAFDGFDADRVAAYDDGDRARLMADAGIVRNRLKVDAAITNARATVALRAQGGLEAFVEGFRPTPADPPVTTADVPTTSPESVALAKALKKAGFVFVGPTTMHALMEAIGLVDDHLVGCHRRGVAAG